MPYCCHFDTKCQDFTIYCFSLLYFIFILRRACCGGVEVGLEVLDIMISDGDEGFVRVVSRKIPPADGVRHKRGFQWPGDLCFAKDFQVQPVLGWCTEEDFGLKTQE